MFLHLSVSHSVHRGVSESVHAGIHPLEQTPPRSKHSPSAVHAGRYGQQVGGTHPTGMLTCLNVFELTMYLQHCINEEIFVPKSKF